MVILLFSVTLMMFYQGVDRRGATAQTDPVKDACLALFSKFGKEVCVCGGGARGTLTHPHLFVCRCVPK